MIGTLQPVEIIHLFTGGLGVAVMYGYIASSHLVLTITTNPFPNRRKPGYNLRNTPGEDKAMSGPKFRDKYQLPAAIPPPSHSVPILSLPDDLQEISIFNTDNPYSLLNLCPDRLKPLIMKIPAEVFMMTEAKFKEKYKPNEIDGRLKLRFWDEWQGLILRSLKRNKIDLSRVQYGTCTQDYFDNVIMKDPIKVANMVIPPFDYFTAMREILYCGISKIRDIVLLPVTSDKVVTIDGKKHVIQTVNTALIGEIRRIVEYLSDRVYGQTPQRLEIEQKNLHAHVQINNPDRKQISCHDIPPESVRELDEQLKRIEGYLADNNESLDAEILPETE